MMRRHSDSAELGGVYVFPGGKLDPLDLGAVAAHLGLSVPTQLLCAALLSGGAVVLWHRQRKRTPDRLPARANPDVNLDIGQTLHIDTWDADGTAQVKYRGALWTVEPMPGVSHTGRGSYRIEQVVGSRLLVVPSA